MDISTSEMEKAYSTPEKADAKGLEDGSSRDEISETVIGNVTLEEGKIERQLKPRQVAMIALGGTIGTGLFISTGSSLSDAGPVNMFIAFAFMGTIVYGIIQSLGEMATFIPITGSFAAFTSRYVSRAFGAANGWLYWFTWAITFAIELDAIGLIINFWTDAVPHEAWIGIFFVILTGINFFPVKFYGEIEFWIASIKVIAIIGWIIYALCMVCGASSEGPIGFRYWRNPGPWGPGILVSNVNTARFLGWLDSLIGAAFTYQGTELVGVTAGEAKNPRKTVPSAINKVFYRILIFYLGSIFFMGMLVPYNDNALQSDQSYVSASPFIIAINNYHTPVLPHIFNAVILSTIISAGNSNVYIGSRILYAMAEAKIAPKFFLLTTPHGVPVFGVGATAIFGLLAFMSASSGAYEVFNWLINITAVGGMIAWALIAFSHIRFMKALKVQGYSRDELPFKALWAPYLAWYAFVSIVIITLIQGFTAFFDFSAEKFFVAYVSLILFVVLYIFFAFVIYRQDPWIRDPADIDLITNRREIEEEEWVEEPAKNLWDKMWLILA